MKAGGHPNAILRMWKDIRTLSGGTENTRLSWSIHVLIIHGTAASLPRIPWRNLIILSNRFKDKRSRGAVLDNSATGKNQNSSKRSEG